MWWGTLEVDEEDITTPPSHYGQGNMMKYDNCRMECDEKRSERIAPTTKEVERKPNPRRRPDYTNPSTVEAPLRALETPP